jgi:hypothetical protein
MLRVFVEVPAYAHSSFSAKDRLSADKGRETAGKIKNIPGNRSPIESGRFLGFSGVSSHIGR